ncbi:MAG: spermidine synthase, partial [Burkholderiaceae bacterium]
MMALALLIPAPERIVQLGLGAGALTKFCHRFVVSAQTVAVEISERVIDAARAWFCVPDDDDRLRIVAADARDFIADRRRCGRADWLQVDLY